MPVVLLGGRNGCGKEKAGTQGIQLSPEFGGHGIEVLGIFRAPGNHAAIHRIFPIDVDSIENSRAANSGSEITAKINVDAGVHKITDVCRLRRIGEAFRVHPPPQGDQDFQFRKFLLQFLELVKGSAKLG